MIKCHLSKLMGEEKLKIADLAKALKVNRSTISSLYHEKAQLINIDVLEKLCKHFNCTISDLIEYRSKAKKKSKNK